MYDRILDHEAPKGYLYLRSLMIRDMHLTLWNTSAIAE